MNFASKDSAPALIVHGDADRLVPIQQAESMIAKLGDNNVPCELVVRKGAGHAGPAFANDDKTMADWFDKYLLEKQSKNEADADRIKKLWDAIAERGGYTETWDSRNGTVYEDVVYDDKAGLKYDLFIPAGASKTKSRGVVLFVHGGGWTGGTRKDMTYAARRYAKAGYISATIDYSLIKKESTVTMYRMLDDIHHAIQAVKDKTTALGFSVDRLAISGASAGGHLSLLYAYSRADKSPIPIVLVFEQTGGADFHADSWGLPTRLRPLFPSAQGRR